MVPVNLQSNNPIINAILITYILRITDTDIPTHTALYKLCGNGLMADTLKLIELLLP